MGRGQEFLELASVGFHAVGEAVALLLALKNDVPGFENRHLVVIGTGGQLPGGGAMVGSQGPHMLMPIGAVRDVEDGFAVAGNTKVLKRDSRKKSQAVAGLQVETH